ncbi:putative RNA helicase [Heterostelium album PN500]|uniref:Putative RNA helicase n=1 Tax=Heterostelium pallidum (strain ATCC 26659 / Pp 5 / PN500) TaxID=670386 RepID=D3B6C6_HETP5|nr:putative RNA helicase [Heterostelium album PN500]EFA82896.1 putative RNA helicase [Heterostelium album PN500]|eukprot:XP_020435013.1 putative RNA helicase [Heterostelium album PN500]
MVENSNKRKSDDDFVMTIDDDENEEIYEDDSDDEQIREDDDVFIRKDSDNEDDDDKEEAFNFDDNEEVQLAWNFAPTLEKMKKQTFENGTPQTSLQDKIQKRLNAKKFNQDEKSKEKKDTEENDETENTPENDNQEEDDDNEEEEEDQIDQVQDGKKNKSDSLKTIESNRRRKQEVEEELPTFQELHLSRPLQKAVQKLGFTMPTPIQAKTIPPSTQCATTGSGKTAAFLLPILERLLYRDVDNRAIRVLVLLPTRELALQCQSVLENLAQFTNITSCLVVGGLSNKVQEVELRKRPDVVIATPGRLIDHLLNAHDVGLDDLEILVLDEADRLLDMGFKDELEKIVESCPANRQSLLFSATLSDEVKTLAKLSLKQPIRVAVDALYQVASTLEQEFVKIRPTQLGDRPALLLSLASRVFNTGGTIIFFKSKKEVHRLCIIFGLAGLSAAELHGDLSQEQRFESLQLFRDGKVQFLLASDVAARGLDVLGVKTVINYNIPRNLAQYIHRVGRTARAGAQGRACSFVTEGDRKILKDIVSRAKTKAKSRTVSQESVKYWRNKIDEMADDIKSIIKEELKEMDIRKAEKEIRKVEKLISTSSSKSSSMEKEWFATNSEKAKAKEAWKIQEGIIDPEELKRQKQEELDKKAGKKADRDPYLGLSRRKRRSKMHREEIAREMAEAEQSDDERDEVMSKIGGKRLEAKRAKPVDMRAVEKKVKSIQNSQKASGKETKRIEALRRVGIYTGPTPQEQLKLDKKQNKKNGGKPKKAVTRNDFEQDLDDIHSGSSSFKKGKVQQQKKKRKVN